MDISPVKPEGIENLKGLNLQKGESNTNGVSFKDTIGKFVNDVNYMQKKADNSIENFAVGNTKDIHEVMISMKKAEMSFEFLMQTRNKLVDAYKEVMRLQV